VPATTNANVVTWTVTFDEPVTGFGVNDIIVTATGDIDVNGYSFSVNSTSATVYSVEVEPTNPTDDGTLKFEFSNTDVEDLAGNAFADTDESNTVTIDNSAPKITALAIANDNSYVDVTFDQGVYTATGGSGAVLPADFATTTTQNGGVTSAVAITGITRPDGNAATGGETNLRFSINLTGTPTGVETFTIAPASNTSVYNAVNNNMETTDVSPAVTINDKTAPALTVTVPTVNGFASGNTVVTFTTSDPNNIVVPVVRGTYSTNTATVLTSGTSILNNIAGFSSIQDGNTTIDFTATDNNGNVTTVTRTFTVDNTDPELQVATLSQPETNGTQTVTITAASDVNQDTPFLEASVDNTNWNTVANGFRIDAAGGWAGLAEGNNSTLYVRASDLAGNTTVESQTIIKDVTAPTLTLTPASNATNVALNSDVVIASNEALFKSDNAVALGDLTPAQIELKRTDNNGASIAYTAALAGNTITLDPTNNFESNDQVYVELNSGFTDKAGNAVTTNYTFQTVDQSTTTIAFDNTSATLSSLADTQAERVKIATLTVVDDANGNNDTKPTRISGLTFTQGSSNTLADYSAALGGFELTRGGTGTTVAATAINANNVTFTGITSGTAGDFGYIDDGGTATYDVYVWIAANAGAAQTTMDGKAIQLELNYNTGVTTAAGGSGLDVASKTTNTDVVDAGADVVEVLGTALSFISQPGDVETGANQTFTVQNIDANGNRDLANGIINAQAISQRGVTIQNNTNSAVINNGIASFSARYNGFGSGTALEVTKTGSSKSTSNTFTVRAAAPVATVSNFTASRQNAFSDKISFTITPRVNQTGGIIIGYLNPNQQIATGLSNGTGYNQSLDMRTAGGNLGDQISMTNSVNGYVVYAGSTTSNVIVGTRNNNNNNYRFVAYPFNGNLADVPTLTYGGNHPLHSALINMKDGDFIEETINDYTGHMFVSEIYPNPVLNGEFSFDLGLRDDDMLTISLNDLAGRRVYTHATDKVYNSGEHKVFVRFNQTELPSGMYMLYVEGSYGAYVVPVQIRN
jgi:hypothetical protein